MVDFARDAGTEPVIEQVSRRRVYSSVEGILAWLTVESKDGYAAVIRDRLTSVAVGFTFPPDQLETVKGLFGKNVVAEGEILFAGNRPLRFLAMPMIEARSRNTPVHAFLGKFPPLPEGELAEDFLERLNGVDAPE